MKWYLLIIAGLFEVGFATCLGKVNQNTGMKAGLWFSGFIFCLAISMVLLYYVTKTIPVGTAYAVWTGIGAAGTVIVGILVFNEPAELKRLFFLSTLILSIVGLKFVSS